MIDASLARRLVDGQFPEWSDLPLAEVAPQGWDSRSFRLGSELVVRLPSDERHAAQVEKEQRWLPILAPQPAAHPETCGAGRAGVRLPLPVVGVRVDRG